MSSLPAEVDFIGDPAASPERMDQAMAFIVAWLRRLESVQPDFLVAIDRLNALGLTRLNEVLSPIFLDAQATAAQLAAIKAAWVTGAPLTQLLADLQAQALVQLTAAQANLAAAQAVVASIGIGSNVQAYSAQLDALAAIAGKPFGRSLVGLLDAAALRTKAELAAMATRDRATVAQLRARTADVGITADIVRDALAYVNVPFAASMTIDCQAGVNFETTLTGNVTALDLSNPIAGVTLSLYVAGDGATARTITAFSSKFKGDLPTLTDITSTKAYELTIKIRGAAHFIVTAVRAL